MAFSTEEIQKMLKFIKETDDVNQNLRIGDYLSDNSEKKGRYYAKKIGDFEFIRIEVKRDSPEFIMLLRDEDDIKKGVKKEVFIRGWGLIRDESVPVDLRKLLDDPPPQYFQEGEYNKYLNTLANENHNSYGGKSIRKPIKRTETPVKTNKTHKCKDGVMRRLYRKVTAMDLESKEQRKRKSERM